MDARELSAEKVVLDIMSHFGFRRNYQVAEYFEVTPQTLSGWIKSGEIPPKHMMKYIAEVLNAQVEKSPVIIKESKLDTDSFTKANSRSNTQKFSWVRTKLILIRYKKTLLGIPLSSMLLAALYVFFSNLQAFHNFPSGLNGKTSAFKIPCDIKPSNIFLT